MSNRFFRPGLLAISASAIALAVASTAQAASPSGWRIQTSISVSGKYAQMNAVAADAPGDAWALGTAQSETSTAMTPLAYHWAGSKWQQVTLPGAVIKSAKKNPTGEVIGASSATNVWAFMSVGHWVHWNGNTWTVGTFPSPGTGASGPTIKAVSVLSTSDVWAFGYYVSAGALVPYAAHFDGTSWSADSPSGKGEIEAASAVSPSDLWALIGGPSGSGATQAVVHWTGSAWQPVPLPSTLATGDSMDSLLAVSDTDVWIGGYHPSVGNGVVAQWNGTTWAVDKFREIKTFATDDVDRMVPDGSGGIWALASCDVGPCWRLWHYTGGSWVGPILPKFASNPKVTTDVTGLANVPGTTSVWGTGGRSASSNSQQGILVLNGSVPS